MRRGLAVLLLAFALTSCTFEINRDHLVPGNEQERRIMERNKEAQGAAASMVLALVVIVPMGLVTLLIATRARGRVTTPRDDVSH